MRRRGHVDIDDLEDGAAVEDLADLFCVPVFGRRGRGGRARKGFPEGAAEFAEESLARDGSDGSLFL